jgi:sulfite reductase (NADPH) flavoprotein alpha-component
MLNNEKKQILNQIIQQFSKDEIAWTSGYLSGFLANNIAEISDAKKSIKDLSIIYITETGNSKFLASEISKQLKSEGGHLKLKAAEQYRLTDLAKEKNLIVIVSTHGEGEIPAAGKKFFDYISQEDLDLSHLNYLVIALGDSNYPLFCQSGKDIDEKLAKLKAIKTANRIELDLDFENSIAEILNQIRASFSDSKEKNEIVINPVKSSQKHFSGEIIANINLNDIGSSKETHHIEIAVDGEISYEAGDSVGILFDNEELKIEGKITPRLYSIASSPNEHAGEIHLTVGFLRYLDKDGKEVEGLFSSHLSRLKIGQKINFYISKNRQFKLPQDDRDIIMVGAGTGIAPFRSFLFERNYQNSSGKNWLFFGERNFQTDFLYQSELQEHLESKLLTKLDIAFSRDQEQKIYVQDCLHKNAVELYNWLENGAYFYICGDKENMAKDVEKALLKVISVQGKISNDEAINYLERLSKEGRYLKDVY